MLRASKSFRFRSYSDRARPPNGEGPKACPLYPSEADIGAVFNHVSFVGHFRTHAMRSRLLARRPVFPSEFEQREFGPDSRFAGVRVRVRGTGLPKHRDRRAAGPSVGSKLRTERIKRSIR